MATATDSEPRTRLRRGLTWEQLADGRVWRLKGGKHFARGGMEAVKQEALMAGAALNRAVVTLRDDLGKWQYLWVQFAASEIAPGAPCPRCRERDVVRVHPRFAPCEACGAPLIPRAGAI